MANAVQAVRSEEMDLKKKKTTTKVFEVSILTNKLTSKETYRETDQWETFRKPVLPANLEEELVSYYLMMVGKFFGLTTKSPLKAFELAI